MENEDDYIPRSPNLSPLQVDTTYEAPLHPQHQSYRGSLSHVSPFSPTGGSDYFGRPSLATPATPYNALYGQQPQSSAMVKNEYDNEEYGAARKGRNRGKRMKQEDEEALPENGGAIEVKTKFPVARIKRIMQADEDVGKVAQVTPVVVSKALELFMISLITKSAAEAKTRNSKRVLPAHLKAAIMSEEQFDFLHEIVGKVADAPSGQPKQGFGGDESDEAEGKKKRGRRRKADIAEL